MKFGIEQILGCDLETSTERSTHQSKKNLANYEFCLAPQLLETLAEKERQWGSPPSAVIHNGACSSTTETDPEVFRTLNVESSQSLFKYCSEKKIPYLYASSASVYGNGDRGFSDAVGKNHTYSPMNMYGQSKHRFDSWALSQTQQPPFWYGLRYFNVFGPYEEHKKSQASILHWGSQQIRNTGQIKLFRSHRDDIEDGEQRRDFVSVFDIVRVTLALLERSLNPGTANEGRFVNIGRGEAASWIETATALFKAMDREPQIRFIDMPQALQMHYQNYTCADLTTLHSLGITEPFLSLEEAFRRSLKVRA